MNPVVKSSHITSDDQGRAWIEGTNVKVLEVVLDHIAYGWSPEEVHWQHPHLSLGQIYAALAYFHDHRTTFDALIQESLEGAEYASQGTALTPIALRLRASLGT